MRIGTCQICRYTMVWKQTKIYVTKEYVWKVYLGNVTISGINVSSVHLWMVNWHVTHCGLCCTAFRRKDLVGSCPAWEWQKNACHFYLIICWVLRHTDTVLVIWCQRYIGELESYETHVAMNVSWWYACKLLIPSTICTSLIALLL